jgi:hypothetical protein
VILVVLTLNVFEVLTKKSIEKDDPGHPTRLYSARQ